jgi:carbamoyltransferase
MFEVPDSVYALDNCFDRRALDTPERRRKARLFADPRRADMKSILNAKIKRREWFRPFAP